MHGVKEILRFIALTTLSFIWPVSAGFCGVVDEAQNLLNRLGYNAGVADGIYGQKTHRALENFYSDLGFKYDGILNEAELSDLENVVSGKGITSYASDTESYVSMELKTKHTVPNKLLEIKVVPNWQPVKDYNRLVDDEAFFVNKNDSFLIQEVKETGFNVCTSAMTNMNMQKLDSMVFTRCNAWAQVEARRGNKNLMAGIMLNWANENLKLKQKFNKNDFNPEGYQLPSMVGMFAQYYALHYASFDYTDSARAKVDSHLKSLLMNHTFPHIGGASSDATLKCLVGAPEQKMIASHMRLRVYHNNCGSIRYKMAVGGIMLAFRLEDQELLDFSHESMHVNFSQFTSEGIGMTHAVKGADTLGYSLEYLRYMSVLNEVYKSVGYDFMEHTLPYGAKVHEAISKGYEAVYDVWGVLGKYAKANSQMTKYSRIKNLSFDEFVDSEFGKHTAYNYENGDSQFVYFHMDWVDRYKPEIDIDDNDIMWYADANNHPSSNIGVDVHLMYWANK